MTNFYICLGIGVVIFAGLIAFATLVKPINYYKYPDFDPRTRKKDFVPVEW